MTKRSVSFLLGLPMALGLTILPALAQQWTFLTNEVPYARDGHSAVYNSGTNQMIVFGGAFSPPGATNDVWLMNNANGATGTPSWILEIPNGSPGAPSQRYGHTAVYDSANDRMLVFGGCLGGCLPTANDTWVLVNATGAGGTPTWQQLSPTGGPPAPRTYHTAVYDQANNRMIIFAGQNGSGSFATYGDVWVLTHANGLGGTPAWVRISPTGGPPSGQYGASAVYDQANNILTAFGGLTDGTGQPTNAVWTLSHANSLGGASVWKRLVANGTPGSPARRAFHTATYDPGSNRMTIYAGGNNVVGFGDIWVLQNANGVGGAATWVKLTVSASGQYTPSIKSSQSAVYDPGTNRMIVFGGGTVEGLSWTTWVLTHANGL